MRQLILIISLVLCAFAANAQRFPNEEYESPYSRDNIISMNGYEIVRQMRGGERVRVTSLYEADNPLQKQALENYFGSRAEVTREDAYRFVRTQFDLLAIKALTGEVGYHLDGASQEQFVEQRLPVLRGVSQAMFEGRFNPYMKDVEIAFQGFKVPGLEDANVVGIINRQRANGNIPNAESALNVMTQRELSLIVGDPNFMDPNSYNRVQRLQILDALLQQDPVTVMNRLTTQDAKDAFHRLIMNHYEPNMANFTWWRAGSITDTSPHTWNGRYGPPSRTALMHMNAWYNFDTMLAEMGPEGKAVFFNGNGTRLNFRLTYEEALSRLRVIDRRNGNTRTVDALNAGIADLSNPSIYMYFQLREDHYIDLRLGRYLSDVRPMFGSPESAIREIQNMVIDSGLLTRDQIPAADFFPADQVRSIIRGMQTEGSEWAVGWSGPADGQYTDEFGRHVSKRMHDLGAAVQIRRFMAALEYMSAIRAIPKPPPVIPKTADRATSADDSSAARSKRNVDDSIDLGLIVAQAFWWEWHDEYTCNESGDDECYERLNARIDHINRAHPYLAFFASLIGALFSPLGMGVVAFVAISRTLNPEKAFAYGAGAEMFEGVVTFAGAAMGTKDPINFVNVMFISAILALFTGGAAAIAASKRRKRLGR